MDLEKLRALVAGGESERVEFKKTTGELRSAMTTLCALLNGSGGKVLFGVTDGRKINGQDVTDATLRELAGELRKIRRRRPSIIGAPPTQPMHGRSTTWGICIWMGAACRAMSSRRTRTTGARPNSNMNAR